MVHYENMELYQARIEAKKVHHVLEFNQSQWIKQYAQYNTKKQKQIEAENMVTKMEKHRAN